MSQDFENYQGHSIDRISHEIASHYKKEIALGVFAITVAVLGTIYHQEIWESIQEIKENILQRMPEMKPPNS